MSWNNLILFLFFVFTYCIDGLLKSCKLGDPKQNDLSNESDYVNKLRASKTVVKQVISPTTIYEIPVIIHVILTDDGMEGNIPLDAIQKNMDLSNKIFTGKSNSRKLGFDSRLRVLFTGIRYHYNSTWFKLCLNSNSVSIDIRYGTSLSVAHMTNVWTCQSDTLGWTLYLPGQLVEDSPFNGFFLHYQQFPSSVSDPKYKNLPPYDLGKTFTHELGHYLGLFHTFGNGISSGCEIGDLIEDTPAEASAAFGKACFDRIPRNTCPTTPGNDPVWNVMDYTDDICAEEFTRGQVAVMRSSIEVFRPSLITRQTFRCVVIENGRGTAKKLSVCVSECFTTLAPDGISAPSEGWCHVNTNGDWGSCCCSGNNCLLQKPVIQFPSRLLCSSTYVKHDLIKLSSDLTKCISADLGGGTDNQLSLQFCSDSIFQKFQFLYWGGINSIGTGWCLALRKYDGKSGIQDGSTVGLEPCLPQKRTQKFNLLDPTKASSKLNLVSIDRVYCLDGKSGMFKMIKCDVNSATQSWVRINEKSCATLKNQLECLNSKSILGCGCTWSSKNKCM